MNKSFLIGRLTRDPDIGEKVARYTLAVDRPPRQDGQRETDFISCVVFGKSIDFVAKYLHKGMKIAVEGRIQTGSYEKDGVKHYTTDVIVDRHEFCEARAAGSQGAAPPAEYEAESYEQESFHDIGDDDGEIPF